MFAFLPDHAARRIQAPLTPALSPRRRAGEGEYAPSEGIVHPRPTALVLGTREGVEVERGDMSAIFIVDPIEPHVGMPHADVALRGIHGRLGLADRDPEQAAQQLEEAVEHLFEREVGAQFGVGVGVTFLAQPLGPERDVPGFERSRIAARGLERLNVFEVANGRVPRGVSQLSEHRAHGLNAGSHLPGEAHLREVAIAEQSRLLLPQLQNAGDQRSVVELAGGGSRDEGPVELFAQHPVAAVLHERLEERDFQRDPPRSGFGRGFRGGVGVGHIPRLGRKVSQRARPACGIDGVSHFQRVRLRRVEHMVRVLGRDLRQLLLDGVEPLALLARESDP